MTEQRQRKLAAIMFTDMVGYTALMQEDELKATAQRDKCREILRRLVGHHGGQILQFYGDGALSTFTSAIEATRCAIKIQQALKEDPMIPVRIGIHVGDVVFEEEGIVGDGVNVASRVESLAPPGGICVSERVFDDIKNQPGMEAKSLGRVELKNVRRPIEIFALTFQGLAVPEAVLGTEKGDVRVQQEGASGKRKEGVSLAGLARRNRAFVYGGAAVLVGLSIVGGLYLWQRYEQVATPASVAVLPFVNMSADPENEYFSDGMTEELINVLSKVEGLRVASRTSAFAFKGKQEDIREIGDKLNVTTILEGSVRKAGSKLRITAQLINIADGYHLWSQTYERDMEDVFAIQDEISRTIVGKLKVKLVGGRDRPLVKRYTDNLEAYNLYLKGRFYWNKWTEEGGKKAIEFFQRAIEKDPEYASAYAGLADSYTVLGSYSFMPPKEAYPRA
ncbi:MAG: adenylate/guanylate cyclase domain-containing protein, partial [Ignavibacteria bacterium]|nr:adenylate/guanylate cyclase domain-containing protein [Ignavibacteria bacterium]